MKSVNLALVGTSPINHFLLEQLLSINTGKLIAILASSQSSQQNPLPDHPDLSIRDTIEEGIKRSEIDAIVISSDLPHQSQWVRMALEAGKHVCVDKPLTMDLDEAQSIIELSKRKNRVLTIMDPALFFEPNIQAREILLSNGIGLPSLYRHRVNPTGKGGDWGNGLSANADLPVVFSPAMDRFSLPFYFLGDVDHVFAYLNYEDTQQKVLKTALIQWKHTRGGLAGMMDYTYSPEMEIQSTGYSINETIEISGSIGNIFVNCGWGMLMEQPTVLHIHGKTQTNSGIGLNRDYRFAYLKAVEYFINRIRKKTKSIGTTHLYLQSLKLQLATIESATKGLQIKIK